MLGFLPDSLARRRLVHGGRDINNSDRDGDENDDIKTASTGYVMGMDSIVGG